MPNEIYDWCVEHLYRKSKKKTRHAKPPRISSELVRSDYYAYLLDLDQIEKIMDNLPDEYFTTHDGFLKLATAAKSFNRPGLKEMLLEKCRTHPRRRHTPYDEYD